MRVPGHSDGAGVSGPAGAWCGSSGELRSSRVPGTGQCPAPGCASGQAGARCDTPPALTWPRGNSDGNSAV